MHASLNKVFGLLFVLGLAVALVGGQADASESACKLVKVSELDVRFEHNRPLVDAQINGQKAVFLLDTGASFSTLFGEPAARLGVHGVETGGVARGVGGARRIAVAVLKSLKLADANLTDFQIAVLNHSGRADQSEVGVLGRDIFGLSDVEFDLASNKVRLFRTENCQRGQSLAYWTQAPEIVDLDRPLGYGHTEPFKISANLNASHVQAILDSGATTSIVTTNAAIRAGVKDDAFIKQSQSTSGGIGGASVSTRIATFDQIVLGDETIRRVKLQVGDFFAANAEEETGSHIRTTSDDLPEMLIGADFLRSHRVLIASSQARIYFTYSGGPVFQSVGAAAKDLAAKP